MANEFVARKGLISSGSVSVFGAVTASSFKGDGSQLTNLPTANTALNIDTYTFVGNSVTTNYTLSQSYDVNSLVVSVDGLTQTNILDYSLSGSILNFVSVPPSESNILVRALVNATQNVTGSFSGSFFGIVTSASYALNAGAGSGFPFSGSAVITGSLYVVPTGSVGGITGSVSGALTGTFPYSGLTGTPSGIVSSSAQYPGWVTSSAQVNSGSFTGSFSGSFNGINLTATSITGSRYTGSFTGSILANNGVVSGAAQIPALLPAGTVSSSTQISSITASLATTGSNTFVGTETISGSLLLNADTLIFTGSLSTSGSFSVVGVITGSIQSASYVLPSGLPAGTVSSSAQINTGSFTGSLTGSSRFTVLPNISIQADNHLFFGTGITSTYTLSQSYDPSILTVSVDGMVYALTEDYTVSTNQLNFVVAPPTSSNIFVKGIRLVLT